MRSVALLLILAGSTPQAKKEPPKLVAKIVPAGIAIGRAGQAEPVLVQHIGPKTRPFLHPIVAPDGKGSLTEDKPGHHPWQHGLYVGMHHVNGQNFWEKEEGFRCRPVKPPTVKGNVATWTAEADWLGENGEPILVESQLWTLTDHGDHYLLDLVHRLKAVVPVTFGKHDYGGLFLRMPFRDMATAAARNSEGQENGKAEQQRARWVAVSMAIEGRSDWGVIAMMDHKSNPGHPVPWRVDGQLGVAPSRCILGDWKLGKGETGEAKYRLLVTCGKIDPARIDKSWLEFSGK